MVLRAIPDGFVERRQGPVRLIARAELADALAAAGALDGRPPAAWGVPAGEVAGGRRALTAVRVPGISQTLLVKPLRRGGWLGPLLGRAASLDRAHAELLVVESLCSAGVPAAPVVAARIVRPAALLPWVHVDLVTPQVAGAENLADWLARHPSSPSRATVLAATGRAIAALHAAGVVHDDLNLRNLLVAPDGGVLVLDLGASRVRPVTRRRAVLNLARLLRSALKVGLVPARVSRTDLARVARAYDPERWRGLGRAVEAACRRSLPFHRLAWALTGRRRV